MSGYRHVVLFRFRDPADTAAHRRAVELLTGLRCCPGVLSWRLAWSEDRRKGPVLVEDVLFGDRPAFDAWRDSPACCRVPLRCRRLAGRGPGRVSRLGTACVRRTLVVDLVRR